MTRVWIIHGFERCSMPSIFFVKTDSDQDSKFLITGMILATLACCLLLLLSGLCFRMLWRDDREVCPSGRRRFIIYISLTGIWAIIALSSAFEISLMTIKDQGHDSSVRDIYRYLFWIPLILISWQSDALLVWRFTLVSTSYRMKYVSIAFLLSSIVVAILFLLNLNRTIVWPDLKSSAIILWSISLALNTILTAMIVFRILRARALLRDVSSVFHGHSHDVYLSPAVTLGISAILYCSWSITVIVSYAVSAGISDTFVMPSGFIQAIISLCTIYLPLRRSNKMRRDISISNEWKPYSSLDPQLESQSSQTLGTFNLSSEILPIYTRSIYQSLLPSYSKSDIDIEKPCQAHCRTKHMSLPLLIQRGPSHAELGQLFLAVSLVLPEEHNNQI